MTPNLPPEMAQIKEALDRSPQVGRRQALLAPVKLPRGMIIWDGEDPEPRLYTRIGGTSYVSDGQGHLVEHPKYHWRCSCGARPVCTSQRLIAVIARGGRLD
jgi:hypothetical protein